jgi:hypothetical protein
MMSKYIFHAFNEKINNHMFIHRYITIVYLSFIHGIPSEAEHLFHLPAQWPGYCGNANAGKL